MDPVEWWGSRWWGPLGLCEMLTDASRFVKPKRHIQSILGAHIYIYICTCRSHDQKILHRQGPWAYIYTYIDVYSQYMGFLYI